MKRRKRNLEKIAINLADYIIYSMTFKDDRNEEISSNNKS